MADGRCKEALSSSAFARRLLGLLALETGDLQSVIEMKSMESTHKRLLMYQYWFFYLSVHWPK